MENLEDLEGLFEEEELDIKNPSDEQLYKMYGIYLNDFIKNKTYFKGCEVKVNHDIVKDKEHGVFIYKDVSFNHIITRESKLSCKRVYDKDRANKIHWIKAIIDNHESPLVKIFEKKAKGHNNIFLWLECKSYIVILREIRQKYLLVTGYCVDKTEKIRFKKEYENYINKKTSLRE